MAKPTLSNTAKSTVLVFAGDCAFCTTVVDAAMDALARTPDRVVPSQWLSDAELADLGLTRDDVTDAAWIVTGRRRFRGHRTASALLRMQPALGARVLGAVLALPPFDGIGALAYRWISANRHRLPGGTPACALPPGARGDTQA